MQTFFAVMMVVVVVGCVHGQSGITACRAGEGYDHFPFCNTSLPLDDRVWDLVHRIDDDIKPNLMTARGFNQTIASLQAIPHLGVPAYYWGQNCIHSSMLANCTSDGRCSTSFPSGPSWAATFDKEAMRQMAVVVGQETRAAFNLKTWTDNGAQGSGLECWGPVININRDPRWGRNSEGGAEDPYLMGMLGLSWTRGVQEGDGRDPDLIQVAVTLKHYVANDLEGGSPDDGNHTRNNYNVNLSNYLLADEYFPAFRTSIRDGGARGVMCSYNAVNGIPTCLSPLLKAARDDWGFKGYVTSDSDSVYDAWANHNYTKTAEEAACLAITDGACDINSGNTYYTSLLRGVEQKLCTIDDVNTALFRSMRVRFELGLFDPPTSPYWQLGDKDIGTAAATELNYQSTLKSLVLVSNPGNILPFKKGANVVVIGPHGNATGELIQRDTGKLCGGDDDIPGLGLIGSPPPSFSCVLSPYMAIKAANPGHTTYVPGCDFVQNTTDNFAAALEAARTAEVVILGLGITEDIDTPDSQPFLEKEGHDRQVIGLPYVQRQLATRILAQGKKLGKPTAVFFLNGGAVTFPDNVLAEAAVIEAFYPGIQGGRALAASIFGDQNRWGRMPYTVYPANWTKTHSMLDHDVTHGRTYRYGADAVVPFGAGLSYTTFTLEIGSPHIETYTLKTDGSSGNLTITVTATNTGTRVGDVVVQAYLHPLTVPSLSLHPIKTLVDFDRLDAVPVGGSAEATFTLSTGSLLLVDESGDRVSAPGRYSLSFEDGSGQVVSHDLSLVGGTVIMDPFPKVKT